MEDRRHSDVIREKLPLPGKRILDVGCGYGTLTRFLAEEDALPIGLDRRPEAIRTATEKHPAGDYLVGCAESLPFADNSFDALIFFNSLHHIDPELYVAALQEAYRTLAPGGYVLVVEPIAEGGYYELMRAVEDVATDYERAYEAIRMARDLHLNAVADISYACPVQLRDYDAFVERLLTLDPTRAGRLEQIAPEQREAFEKLGQRQDDGWLFRQPTRVNLLQRL